MIDPNVAINAVEEDVAVALREQLPDGEGFALDDAFPGWADNPLSDSDSTAVVIPWRWDGRNAGLLGLAATRRPITVRGVTIVTEDRDELLCQRYVDWLPALSQAGIALFTRPIVELSTVYTDEELRETPELAEALDEIQRVRDQFGLSGTG